MNNNQHAPVRRLPDPPYTVWITGLSASGKTTLGRGLSAHLRASGIDCEWLDGEEIRKRLPRSFGYSTAERVQVVVEIGNIAEELTRQGKTVIVSTISHVRTSRQAVRERLRNFFEIYLKCSPEVCALRDTKGQYDKAFKGQIDNFIGVTEAYEESWDPELTIDTSVTPISDTLAIAVRAVMPAVQGEEVKRT